MLRVGAARLSTARWVTRSRRALSSSETVAVYGGGGKKGPATKAKRPTSVLDLQAKMKSKTPITMVTAYDYPAARQAESAGVDCILVGDSVGMCVLGYESTVSVTMADMLHHCKAVSRGASRPLLVGDLPFGSYLDPVSATANAVRLLKEGGMTAVKLEGGRRVLPMVEAIVKAGIPVIGHVGLLPQSAAAVGGFKVQGKTARAAASIVEDAIALEEAGCCAVVVEAVPSPVAAAITAAVDVPTIGIGAGSEVGGQVLVYHDICGLFDRKKPKFAKCYADAGEAMEGGIEQYVEEVLSGEFPTAKHAYAMPADELELFNALQSVKTSSGLAVAPASKRAAKRAPSGFTSSSTMRASFSTAAGSGAPRAARGYASASRGAPSVLRSMHELHSARNSWEPCAVGGAAGEAYDVEREMSRVGLVPTMGAVHEGHLSLVRRAASENEIVLGTVFVNPAQFAPHEDFGSNPGHETLDADAQALVGAGCHHVFAPTAAEMYPPDGTLESVGTLVDVRAMHDTGEALSLARGNSFFQGVATVVTKLFGITRPTNAYFGQKDALQCAVIRRMVSDLNLPINVVVCDTVREADGLAMSSRNAYLSARQRAASPALFKALSAAQAAWSGGERNAGALQRSVLEGLEAEPQFSVQYVNVADQLSMRELGSGDTVGAGGGVAVSAAVQIGDTRLLDNILLQ